MGLVGSLLFTSLVFAQGKGEIPVTASNAARDFFQQGLAKVDSLQTAAARDLFQKAVEADPNFAMAHLFYGLTGGQGGLQANLKKVVDLVASASEGERLFIQGYQLNTSQQPAKAIETLQQVIKLHPTAKRAHLYLAQVVVNQDRIDEALVHFNRAVEIDPNFLPARLGRGQALVNKGQSPAARKDFQFVLDRVPEGPTWINPLSQVALAYTHEGNVAEAANYYERAIGLAEKSNQAGTVAGFCNALGRIYLEHGDVIRASELYQRGYEAAMKGVAEDQKPLWQARYYHARSRILAKVGEFDAAIGYVDKIKAIIDSGANPRDHLNQIYQYLVGYIHLDRHEFDKAVNHLKQADQTDPFIQMLIARALEGKGDQTEAANWYKKVVAEYHGNSASYALSRPHAAKWMKEKKTSN
jgi:tetratricopeptide (TPR) repeat protein